MCWCKYFGVVFSWSVFLTLAVAFLSGPCVYYFGIERNMWWVTAVFAVFIVYVAINFLTSGLVDPGVLPRASHHEAETYGPPPHPPKHVETDSGDLVTLKWCATCGFYRPPRTSHCSECDVCILLQDHHCIWINNCIGVRNYRHFYLFINSRKHLSK